ncbi:MAG TPA: acyl-CoA dehydrogenase family protein [Rubrivivax sp.]|nr:acyl-CoA dehydrogenase family protein [Rubrivivax sp.]
MDALLADSFERLLAGVCSPAVVREVERSADASALWTEVEASGFLGLLVLQWGGATLRDAFPLWLACGAYALPLPLAQTMWARGVLAAAGLPMPAGPVALAPGTRREAGGALRCPGVPFGALARALLLRMPEGEVLCLPLADAAVQRCGVHGSLQADIVWPSLPADALRLPPGTELQAAGALITATLMAGALQQLLAMTLRYANERAQFGKPIAKFQAVQQQLAVLAEQAFAARMAAQIGCAEDGVQPQRLRAAVAKARAAEAADKAVAIAHAVHGAIGVTAEFDLQLLTRRLQEWRGDHGSASYWHAELGRALIAAQGRAALPFLLDTLLPGAAARPEDGT